MTWIVTDGKERNEGGAGVSALIYSDLTWMERFRCGCLCIEAERGFLIRRSRGFVDNRHDCTLWVRCGQDVGRRPAVNVSVHGLSMAGAGYQ